MLPVVRAEDVPEPFVASLTEEELVDFSDDGEEAVRVVDRVRDSVPVDRLDPVVVEAKGVGALPDAVGEVLQLDSFAARSEDRRDALGKRTAGADDRRPVCLQVLPEDRVRPGVRAVRDRAQLAVREADSGAAGWSSSVMVFPFSRPSGRARSATGRRVRVPSA